MNKPEKLELLSPATNAEIAIQAILHGADAVYIGASSHGARKAASNSIDEIKRVVDFAHTYRAKVYITVNTIVYENELKEVEQLCRDIYKTGADALIVQDMALLRLDLPPIALHASTQCDIRTPEKAKFLEEVGFSQLVLARELTLEEIKRITESVSIPVETFIHGALCVSYSGRCHASWALTGRSANRGECAQICRLPYTLKDCEGKEICNDKYLLSLKDFNASHQLEDLIDAGVRSFKIEGRLKDMSYVKNITSFYNQKLNNIVEKRKGCLSRNSYGETKVKFTPQPDKSFNRGFTNYFLEKRKPLEIASLLTPKSLGEKIENVSVLNNGDGISFIDKEGKFTGVNINRIEGNRIIPARKIDIPRNAQIYRTSNIKWEQLLTTETASRKIGLDIIINNSGITAEDERGVRVKLPLDIPYEKATKPMDFSLVFSKLGNTPYKLNKLKNYVDSERFYRASELTVLRRNLISCLDRANKATYPFEYRREENRQAKFPYEILTFQDNVANSVAKKFYHDHGVKLIERAAELDKGKLRDKVVMTTRHCILRELGMCLKEKGKPEKYRLPLYLKNERGEFILDLDCRNCEMKVKLPEK
ncbi:MAG: U32 family peptidase [Muribaculaceae bacterium]|nr:U32 family peptidase [Muribaculaceae bacterium]